MTKLFALFEEIWLAVSFAEAGVSVAGLTEPEQALNNESGSPQAA